MRLAWAVDVEDGSGTGAPSQSKLLAYFFALCVCFGPALNWQQVVAMGLILAASYGRSLFRHALNTVQSIFTKSSPQPDTQ